MPHNTLTDAEKAAGWRLLFDGKTLTGWRGYRLPAGQNYPNWAAEDGELRVHGKGNTMPGDILTVDQFGDFELSLDFTCPPHGNSGIMYRVVEVADQPYMTGPEFQILDDAAHPDAKNGAIRHTGSCYELVERKVNATKPLGEWNHARIVVQGNHVQHFLNGQLQCDFQMHDAAWNARVAATKFRDWPHFAKSPRGHIDLQDHGHEHAFRNIKIRAL
jgi:hypothetical protein